MARKILYWKLRTAELQLGERTLIMGVLNVTPDSFHDGGRYLDPDRAFARAIELEEQGADIIDIGAESTRPDAKRISAEEEWQRLVPVLKRLRDKLEVPLSIDTYKHEIAERALEYGVEIINDPSGLTFDPDLAKAAANGNAGLILNHMRGTPESWAKLPPLPDVVGTVVKDLEATASRARRAGVEKNRIVLDPGLGFGKRKEQNAEILAQLGRLATLEYPVLAAPSRKSFLSHVVESGMALQATSAAVAAAILNGAHIVRVHDVKEMKAVAQVADEIARAGAAAERASEVEKPRVRVPRAGFQPQEKAAPPRPPVVRAEPVRPVAGIDPPREEIRPAARTPQPEKVWEKRKDRPFRREDREKRPWSADGKPPRRDSGDRPRWTPGGKPPRREEGENPRWSSSGRPSRRDGGDKPRWTPGSKPPRREGRDRPPVGERRGPVDGGPKGKPGGRPFRGGSRSGKPPRPFRKRP